MHRVTLSGDVPVSIDWERSEAIIGDSSAYIDKIHTSRSARRPRRAPGVHIAADVVDRVQRDLVRRLAGATRRRGGHSLAAR